MEFMEYLKRTYPAPTDPHADVAHDILRDPTSPSDPIALRAHIDSCAPEYVVELFDEIYERYLREQQA